MEQIENLPKLLVIKMIQDTPLFTYRAAPQNLHSKHKEVLDVLELFPGDVACRIRSREQDRRGRLSTGPGEPRPDLAGLCGGDGGEV
jgi:hypothetical protein